MRLLVIAYMSTCQSAPALRTCSVHPRPEIPSCAGTSEQPSICAFTCRSSRVSSTMSSDVDAHVLCPCRQSCRRGGAGPDPECITLTNQFKLCAESS
ncbi:hypothetical protein B0J12DRAFT_650241 [Macrophomina phaseolina]|uniref:Uncharacterized protein n=1 Tax=Macrophomina phaseolina TaxID=35725 RepID=A0ABQ8GQ11_9PEZI|nr:hypothetical protein B0J12DRAFT_650241 [Macrophomina phaseolina]